MSTLFSFRWQQTEPETRSILVIFGYQTALNTADFWEALNEDVGTRLAPDAVYVLVRQDHFISARNTLASLPSDEWRINPDGVPVVVQGYDASGSAGDQALISGPNTFPASEDTLRHAKAAGILALFKRRDGLLLPGNSTHYIHPSGRHSRGFLRAANLLIQGPDVAFVAMCLLSYLPNDTAYIWVDTSSISSLAYALVTLRHEMDRNFAIPVVNSFSSYDRLENAQFGQFSRSLALISATTSGNLSRKLVKKGFLPEKVVTLFSLAKDKSGLTILCDLSEDEQINPNHSYSSTEDHTAADCPMCKTGSKPVRFVGDQFLADAIVYSPYTILAADAPKNLNGIMRDFSGRGAFGVKARKNSDLDANEIWISIDSLSRDPDFRSKIRSSINRYGTAATDAIVHTDDTDCSMLANLIKSDLSDLLGRDVPVYEMSQFEKINHGSGGSVLAVIACIGSGRAGQAMSQALRDATGDSPRTYWTAFIKYGQMDSFARVRSDLTYNHLGYKHELVSLSELRLPVLPRSSPWSLERHLLLELREAEDVGTSGDKDQVIAAIDKRLEQLGVLATGTGSSLFWPDAAGRELRLRQTFAFWNFRYESDKVSQGDVFATIGSILEHLRTESEPKIVHTNFYHTLISPSCFGRYNDGIIQASLIRSAMPQELNYSADETVSESMLSLLLSMNESYQSPRGEAFMEFILAIACDRLTLMPNHLQDLVNAIKMDDPIVRRITEYCRSKILTRA